MATQRFRLIAKALIGGLLQVALYAVALLVPAGLVPGGTWYWPRAILFLGLYAIALEASVVALGLVAPASLAARLSAPVSRQQPRADRVATAFLVLSTLGWLAFVPVDVFALKVFPPAPPGLAIGGAVLSLAGFAITIAAIYENAFAIPIVEDQSGRAQVLVETGLYACVRHPMYLGILAFHAGLALWLESYASLLTLVVLLSALVLRIWVEERTLRKTLPEYTGYMTRVRRRLVPGVW